MFYILLHLSSIPGYAERFHPVYRALPTTSLSDPQAIPGGQCRRAGVPHTMVGLLTTTYCRLTVKAPQVEYELLIRGRNHIGPNINPEDSIFGQILSHWADTRGNVM